MFLILFECLEFCFGNCNAGQSGVTRVICVPCFRFFANVAMLPPSQMALFFWALFFWTQFSRVNAILAAFELNYFAPQLKMGSFIICQLKKTDWDTDWLSSTFYQKPFCVDSTSFSPLCPLPILSSVSLFLKESFIAHRYVPPLPIHSQWEFPTLHPTFISILPFPPA